MINNKKSTKILVLFILLMLQLVVFTGCEKLNNKQNNSDETAYEQPIKSFIEGVSECNIDKFLSAFPEFYSEKLQNTISQESLESMLQNEKNEYGEDVKITYTVMEKTEIEAEKLNELKEKIKNNLNEDVNVTQGYNLKIQINTKGEKKEDSDIENMYVYKINDKWCIIEL